MEVYLERRAHRDQFTPGYIAWSSCSQSHNSCQNLAYSFSFVHQLPRHWFTDSSEWGLNCVTESFYFYILLGPEVFQSKRKSFGESLSIVFHWKRQLFTQSAHIRNCSAQHQRHRVYNPHLLRFINMKTLKSENISFATVYWFARGGECRPCTQTRLRVSICSIGIWCQPIQKSLQLVQTRSARTIVSNLTCLHRVIFLFLD